MNTFNSTNKKLAMKNDTDNATNPVANDYNMSEKMEKDDDIIFENSESESISYTNEIWVGKIKIIFINITDRPFF